MSIDDLDLRITYTPAERQFLLYEFFQKHTSCGHAVSRKEILDYLETFGISISPHTLYNDINILRSAMKLDIAFDPHIRNRGAGGYWLKNPKFEPYELRLLVDGIQSSKFITQGRAREITQKITDLADVYTKADLKRQTFVAGRVRSMNESVVQEADRIHQAIAEDRQIAFRYFHYTPDKSNPKSYSKNGNKYIVSPYALLWNDGNYYLYAYDGVIFRYFRVDRMENISPPRNERREGKELYREKTLTIQKAKVFDMFSGTRYQVKMRFYNGLADAVIDQFGKDVMMIPFDQTHFTITVPVEISPTFFAWISIFGSEVKILEPEQVVQKMREFIEEISKMYEDD